jgi:hypothetical protein
MLDDHRSAAAHAVRIPRRKARGPRRAWRRRSRRAQVSAVATILGLLIVVTFIANYIATALPSTMGQNDLQHEVAVEDQLAQLSALLQSTAGHAPVGAQVSQPITLGSAGAPPFAGSDGSVVSPLPRISALSVSYDLVGPLRLPNGGVPNNGSYTGKCSGNFHDWKCTGKAGLIWNFTAGNNSQYFVNGSGQFSVAANFTTNDSLISVGSVGGASDIVSVFGDRNSIFVNGTGGATLYVEVIGSNNTLTLTSNGGSTEFIYVVGNYDTLSTSNLGASSHVLVTAYGIYDHYSDSQANAVVYYIGFNVENPTAGLCPYANLANTDTVGGIGGSVFYNNTNSTNTNTTSGGWAYHYTLPPPSACPYVVTAVISQTPVAAGFIVSLRNTYAPTAEVAFDEGAVVFAQPGGIPIFVVPPRFSFNLGVLKVFVPQFESPVATEAGTGTAEASLRLLASSLLTFPSSGFTIGNNSPITITVVSPYWAAWMGYFTGNPGFAPYVSCTIVGGGACPALTSAGANYYPGGPVGQITVTVPAQGVSLYALVAFYAFSLG